MKKVKQEGAAGLQEWLSYQSRTREVIQPATDIIDWDEGIEVQEEWLPRELCEQRLREEAERKQAQPAKSAATPSAASAVTAPSPVIHAPASPIVEIEDIPLATTAAAEPSTGSVALLSTKQHETRDIRAREGMREVKSKPAMPTQFEFDDLLSAVAAFHR